MSRRRKHDVTAIAVCVAASLAALSLTGWVVRADAIASATAPAVSVTWSAPDGELTNHPLPNPPPVPAKGAHGHKGDHGHEGHEGDHGRGHRHHPGGPSGSSDIESFSLSVLPAPLHVTPTSETLPLTQARGRGESGPFYGELSSLTVVATGSLSGWRAFISLGPVEGLSASQLAHAHLCVTPDVPTRVSGNTADVVQGSPPHCGRLGTPISVFFAAPGGGGGIYSDSAALSLVIPGGLDNSALMASLHVFVL